jgi:glutamine synthetase
MQEDEIIQDALGQHVYERYVEAKTLEWNDYLRYVTQWELDRYLKVY